MQYPFTEEQLAMSDLVGDFMEKEVAPVASEMDRSPDPKDCYPAELINKASKLGIRTMAVPEEWGGAGADTTTKALCLWRGAQTEVGVIKCLSQCWKISTALAKRGSEAQKEKWLKMFVEDDDCVGSFCMTEPDYGSDNLYRQSGAHLGLKMSAVEDGDYYVLNGVKRFTSLTTWAKILVVFARTDPNADLQQGTTCFLVHGDQEGVSYGRVHDKMGYRLYPNAESFYDNVRVHKDDILGELNKGYLVQATIFRGSAELAACNTGVARGIFNFCNQYTKDRVQGGVPIIEHPTIRHMMAEMLMNIEVAEQFMWRICWGVENDETFNSRFTRYGKVFSDQMALKTIALATDVLGGSGIMKENPVEKMIRDLITFLHGDGTDSLTLLRAAQTLDEPC
jgi:alkylation response protein AidB-like acyl-CoA dehydrogenase